MIASGTLVLTSFGYKEIQEIDAGSDFVFSKESGWDRVISWKGHAHIGEVIDVICAGNDTPIQVTSNHTFLTKCVGESVPTLRRIPSSELQKDVHMLCMPLSPTHNSNSIPAAVIAQAKWDHIGRVFGNPKYADENIHGIDQIILGEFTSDKHVTSTSIINKFPEWMHGLSIVDIQAFIEGFESNAAISATARVAPNELVALHLQRLYAKLKRFIEVKIVGCDVLIVEKTTGKSDFDNDYMYVPIRAVDCKIKEGRVYDVKTNNDSSFLVENFLS